ncbi:CaiB/BaiF CoA transferase family protein [Enterovirga aerilata]|uniref:CoA transferase n=1 Tax=Enterovirga aerilata TaxID=2730920 RepID=A0A849IDR8_9HYPH|nr:CaiB/BaiF CoA-transferase family protein [Enterovirga sp. DB1703]NNM74127.1 CoA transferase [Enterovirga sp. DB1703]
MTAGAEAGGPLAGIRVVEFAAQGPGPFCGMLLADLGAEVTLIERAGDGGESARFGRSAIFHRGKRSIILDLKRPEDVHTALRLVARSDALIEGMRPGVMERLGLGPDICLARNPALVYGRVTGWGQDGPLAQSAGHDINYIGLSGALWYASPPGEPPVVPATLIGDVGGGALYLAVGILAGLLHARAGGAGQVVDAAIVDGSAHMLNLLFAVRSMGELASKRGQSAIDGAHWWGSYRCADGLFITVGSIEPKFYGELLSRLGLTGELRAEDQNNENTWERGRELFAATFATKTREEWRRLLEGTDSCFAPVLNLDEAAAHPHNAARSVFVEMDGMLQAAPAPRLSGHTRRMPGRVPARGEHQEAILAEIACSAEPIG